MDEIFDKSNESKKENLIFALNEITINLDEEDSRLFLTMSTDKIQELNKTFQKNKEDEY